MFESIWQELLSGEALLKEKIFTESSDESIKLSLDSLLNEGILREEEGGYRLSEEFQPLKRAAIMAYLNQHHPLLAPEIDLMVSAVTGSTNSDLLAAFDTNQLSRKITVATAEQQRAGRGRRGKEWSSPFGVNLYYSLGIELKSDRLPHLQSLSLWVGVELAKILESHSIPAKVKWPNDLWVERKKLGGILIESRIHEDRLFIVIGIGLNHRSSSLIEATQAVTSCESILGREGVEALNRNHLIGEITLALVALLSRLDGDSNRELQKIWPEVSALYRERVRILREEGVLLGEEIGISESGGLLILDQSGERQTFYSGDVSLRGESD